MARFISQHRGFVHGVRGAQDPYLGPDGVMVPGVKPLEAAFTPDLRNDTDLAYALSHLSFRGLPIYENGQEVSPAFRVSVFDTEVAKLQNGWSDEDEQAVIAALRGSSMLGGAFVEYVPDPAAKPWPGYDEVESADRAVELALAIDADLTQALQYERENLDRKDFVAAFKDAIAAADETIVVRA